MLFRRRDDSGAMIYHLFANEIDLFAAAPVMRHRLTLRWRRCPFAMAQQLRVSRR